MRKRHGASSVQAWTGLGGDSREHAAASGRHINIASAAILVITRPIVPSPKRRALPSAVAGRRRRKVIPDCEAGRPVLKVGPYASSGDGMARMIREYDKDCGCGRCSTWAHIEEYACGCVKVDIHNDRAPCAECTNFSGRREYCGRSGHPDNH